MEFIVAAFTLGFLGSVHCIGMCGPIAMALPLSNAGKLKRATGAFVYNFGRAFTYALLGGLFGLLGKGFVISGYQQILSISLGVILLAALLFPNQLSSQFGLTKVIAPLVAKVRYLLGSLFKQKKLSSLFFIGVLNGLLPCGLVYVAVAGAIATGEAGKGSIFMALFGLGTIPAMLTVSLLSTGIHTVWRNRIRRAAPFFIGLMACIFILRGLNLGIPYLSPELSKTDCTQHTCCHK